MTSIKLFELQSCMIIVGVEWFTGNWSQKVDFIPYKNEIIDRQESRYKKDLIASYFFISSSLITSSIFVDDHKKFTSRNLTSEKGGTEGAVKRTIYCSFAPLTCPTMKMLFFIIDENILDATPAWISHHYHHFLPRNSFFLRSWSIDSVCFLSIYCPFFLFCATIFKDFRKRNNHPKVYHSHIVCVIYYISSSSELYLIISQGQGKMPDSFVHKAS